MPLPTIGSDGCFHYLVWLGRDDTTRLLLISTLALFQTFAAVIILIHLFTSPPSGGAAQLVGYGVGFLLFLVVLASIWLLLINTFRTTLGFLVVTFDGSTCTIAHTTGMSINTVEHFPIDSCSYDIAGATIKSSLGSLVRKQAYCLALAAHRRPVCVLATRWTFEDAAALPRSLEPALPVFTASEPLELEGEWSLTGRIYRFDPSMQSEPFWGKAALWLAGWNHERIVQEVIARGSQSSAAPP